MESILTSIRSLLGPSETYTHFDNQIIMHINSAFVRLRQLGVGPPEVFSINNDSATWSDFIGNNKEFNSVKTYIYLKVKLAFDPPTNSSLLESMKEQIKELEWTLREDAEFLDEEVESDA